MIPDVRQMKPHPQPHAHATGGWLVPAPTAHGSSATRPDFSSLPPVLPYRGVPLLEWFSPFLPSMGFPYASGLRETPFLPAHTPASELVSHAPFQLLGWPLHIWNFVPDGGFSDSVTPSSQLFQGDSLCAFPPAAGLQGCIGCVLGVR